MNTRQDTTLFIHRRYDDFLEKDSEVSYTASAVIYNLEFPSFLLRRKS